MLDCATVEPHSHSNVQELEDLDNSTLKHHQVHTVVMQEENPTLEERDPGRTQLSRYKGTAEDRWQDLGTEFSTGNWGSARGGFSDKRELGGGKNLPVAKERKGICVPTSWESKMENLSSKPPLLDAESE